MKRAKSQELAGASMAIDPLPSVEALGRYARQLSDVQHAFDIAGNTHDAARGLAFWREDAVKEMALTLQPRTMADAVVTLCLVMDELENMNGFETTKHEKELVLAKVRRALAGLLPVVIEASGVNAADLVEPFYLQKSAEIFDPITEQLEKELGDLPQE